MYILPVSGFTMIEETEAEGETAELFEALKQAMGFPFVPNMDKAIGIAPNLIKVHMAFMGAMHEHLTLPESLYSIISYCISTAKNCTYCSVNHELYCRTLGVDEEMLNKLAQDLGNVNPVRLRAIIEFAVKCAVDPQRLVAEDYDQVRAQGVSEEELLEIIFIAAAANFADTLADGLKIEVETMVMHALGRNGH